MVRRNSGVVVNRNNIIRLLYNSKTLRRPIGINSKILGSKTRFCYVMGVVVTDEITVILQPYDASGKMIGKNILSLSQIESVVDRS
jgi:hypothetical protein